MASNWDGFEREWIKLMEDWPIKRSWSWRLCYLQVRGSLPPNTNWTGTSREKFNLHLFVNTPETSGRKRMLDQDETWPDPRGLFIGSYVLKWISSQIGFCLGWWWWCWWQWCKLTYVITLPTSSFIDQRAWQLQSRSTPAAQAEQLANPTQRTACQSGKLILDPSHFTQHIRSP